MKIHKTFFEEVFHIELEPNIDERGSFTRFFCKETFKKNGVEFDTKQISFATNNKKHTLRGMHFQKDPRPEHKFIYCLKGSIWDVVVDIRPKSSNYRKWFAIELSEEKQNCLFIPSGFAHGYLTLSLDTQILYMMNEYYNPEYSFGIKWNDPDINIKWPHLPLKISNKDKGLPKLIDL